VSRIFFSGPHGRCESQQIEPLNRWPDFAHRKIEVSNQIRPETGKIQECSKRTRAKTHVEDITDIEQLQPISFAGISIFIVVSFYIDLIRPLLI
jgi:hypothetical protein